MVRLQTHVNSVSRYSVLTILAFLTAVPAWAVGKAPAQDCISLAGTWRFEIDRDDIGRGERWFERDLPGSIVLPGSMAQRGLGDDISVDTQWTGGIVDRSWFTDDAYARYREPGRVKVPFWLTPVKHYVGPAWYQREIIIPKAWRSKEVVLRLERCHWETSVWIDGTYVGSRNSLATPHEYELGTLGSGRHRLTISVDNRLKIDVGQNAHSVSDHTQTSWNGIVGQIELWAHDPVWIKDVQVYPNVGDKLAKVRVALGNDTHGPVNGKLTLQAVGSGPGGDRVAATKQQEVQVSGEAAVIEVVYPMGNDVLLWDEFSPNMYQMTVSLSGAGAADCKAVQFGMRQIGTQGTQFTINGRKRFLRGTLECCIFPLTGYPPTDVDGWLRIIRIAKAHGLNHFRFHSWCPPEAAFIAADQEGFLLHVECDCWTTVGDNPKTDAFIYAEADRILQAYGNHPSFCFMAYGNEPGGGGQKRFLGDLVNSWKAKDPRRLYTSAAGWPIIPENQYDSTPAPRGHQWGAGLTSRMNARPGETLTDYSAFIAQYSVPVVSHEIGQWCVYPNFDEIAKYTGVLRAYNFEIFRDTLAANHMLDRAHDFLMASGKLQTLLYKEEIESALRTPGFGGFQLLDLHDFPGQGTALVGVLDAFWDSKGYVTPEEYHRFACETVPLARMARRTWTYDEIFAADIEIAHFGPAPMERAVAEWNIAEVGGKVLASGSFPAATIPLGNGTRLGHIDVPLSGVGRAAKFVLTVSLKGTQYANDWDFWVYPTAADTSVPQQITVVHELDDAAIGALQRGGKVLLLADPKRVKGDEKGRVEIGFTTIFWNTAWTRHQAPHTLGILCDPRHPMFADFPTEYHSNWQWWDIVTNSRPMTLNDLAPEVRPTVQVIDDWFANRRLGLVFEARVAGGSLLVCSADIEHDLADRPAARQFRHGLLAYMAGAEFRPEYKVEVDAIRNLFAEPPLMARLNAKIVKVDSADSQNKGFMAIDGDTGTFWHTAWENETPDYPHEIQIDLGSEAALKGFTYLPRQDMRNGWIAGYELYLSDDPESWNAPVSTGTFADNGDLKTVMFDRVCKGRYLRMVALKGFRGQRFASIAELDLIAAP